MMTIKQFYLLKLMEECSEVAQRCSKQIQFGADESQANSPSQNKIETTNRERLREEVNDLLALIDALIELGEIPKISPEALADAKYQKLLKVLKYREYSRQLGLVEPIREPEPCLIEPPCLCDGVGCIRCCGPRLK